MANTKHDKILYAIHHNPKLIGTLLKDTSINKGMIYRELKKAVPCRIGIEFELSGDFKEGFTHKYAKAHKKSFTRILRSSDNVNEIMTRYYKCKEIKGDNRKVIADDIYEIRCSISDYHELVGLYNFMQDLSEFCKLHEGGGIHIHIDLSQYKMDVAKKKEVIRFITHRLDRIASIFPKYTGKYNKKRVGDHQKASWVNLSHYNTIEFRIAPLTFDYSTLMSWIVQCVKLRNELIYYCKLNLNNQRQFNNTIIWQDITDEDLQRVEQILDNINETTRYIDYGQRYGQPSNTTSLIGSVYDQGNWRLTTNG